MGDTNSVEGLNKVNGCDDPNRRADVIFIHGLDGDAVSTWQAEGKPENFWPQWLGADFPDVGIWSLGYAVHASAWKGSTMPLVDRATNILDQLDLDDIGRRPVIFICHSLGGLVVKQMLKRANDLGNVGYQRISDQTKGIVFLSTPHSGSNIANWMKHLGTVLRTTVSVDELEAHHPRLRELNDWYRNYPKTSQIKTLVYCEKIKLKGVLVVDETSADPGIKGVIPIPMDDDHVTICKPNDKNAQVYRRVKRLLEEVIKNFSSEGGGPDKFQIFIKQQKQAFANFFEKSEYKTIQTVAISVLDIKQSSPNAHTLVEKFVDVLETEGGRVTLLEKLLEITGQVVETGYNQVLWEGLESLLSHSLLLTVPMAKLDQLDLHSNKPLALNVKTEMAAELYLACLYGIPPKFDYKIDEEGRILVVAGRYGRCIAADDLPKSSGENTSVDGTHIPEAGWDEGLIADEVERIVQKQVTGQCAERLDEFDREELNQTLKTEREPLFGKLHRVEVNLRDNSSHPLQDPKVVSEVKLRLSELPVINYGTEVGDDEAKIHSLVKSFYSLIGQHT